MMEKPKMSEEFHILVLSPKSEKLNKYVNQCQEMLKKRRVKIIGRQYAICKAFSVLENLKSVIDINYSITFQNLEAMGPDRRKKIEVHILISLKG
ncbi:conserved protein, unknown function [Hepatocystis sp. ex Piliocolobus tephrosceles]|nr:conserved protein, unknown function [Hepatocystis sp. ex Piliocolobus tephrosceles]